LKAVLLDDADDTTSADREAGLAELLCDDVDRGVRIEEAVTDDLANELVGADIVAFGPGLMALESLATLVTVEFEQLEVPLLADIELLSGFGGTKPFALAFDNHGDADGEEVSRTNRELSGGANDAVARHVELHGLILQGEWARRALANGTLGE
jgi:hypothetical protein